MKTPELDKMRAVNEKSQIIGEFLDLYLREKRIHLCQWRDEGDNGKPRYVWKKGIKKAKLDGASPKDRPPKGLDYRNDDAEYNPEFSEWTEGYIPVDTSVEQLLADYFKIDLKKIEQERRMILDEFRKASEAKAR